MKGFQSFNSGLPDTRQAFELLARAAATPAAARPAAPTGPVVLYGAGELGQMALDWCRQQEVTVLAAVDANADRWREHPAWSGISLWTPETVPAALRQEHPLLLCLSTLPLQGIVERLQAQGWHDLRTFYDFVDAWPRRQSLNNGWHAAMPEGQSLAQTREVLSLWHDDVSRAHHLQFLAWRCLREEWQFADAPVHVDQRYAIPEFVDAWRPGERLLDAGAHHGQLIARHASARPGELAHVWAVEPDAVNRQALETWCANASPELRSRIEVHDFALGRRAGHRSFVAQQGYASRLWGRGPQRVPVRALDDLPWDPSFIKLHLEGGEWRALQGGANMLRACAPLITLTVYHRRDGLHHTAHWLMQLLPDYQWRFRLHGWIGTAAVIYGIPPHRL